MENLVIRYMERQQKKIEDNQGSWGLSQVSRLNKKLEEKEVYISNHLWDLLIFNVKELYCNEGKLSIVWADKESKKVLKLIRENYKYIVENYNYIAYNIK